MRRLGGSSHVRHAPKNLCTQIKLALGSEFSKTRHLPDGSGPRVHAEEHASGLVYDLEYQQRIVIAVGVRRPDDEWVAVVSEDHAVHRRRLADGPRVPAAGVPTAESGPTVYTVHAGFRYLNCWKMGALSLTSPT